ncbi:MAG: Crp/Fnr family transcriptional regulator [Desulfobacterales bacterium]|nr:Crp/Fnr family transcriptional regulator [Desulfobacterales bacterium]MBF0397404.1 Crp/Fnr family transcriptional regulator [Desulfobacterales bacterium]
MKNIHGIIAKSSIFNGLPEHQMEPIYAISVVKNFKKGEFIFSEGDLANGFYIIIDGLIKIFKGSPEGKEQTLHLFGSGEPFGEVPVFSGEKFPANAQSLTASSLVFIPRKAFVDLINKNPSLALNMLAVLSMRLRQFTVQIENLSLKEIPSRLSAYLLYLSEEQKNKKSINLSISKGELASLLGTIPETLSRILNKMTEQNLIGVTRRNIQILNYSKLKEIAEHGKIE